MKSSIRIFSLSVFAAGLLWVCGCATEQSANLENARGLRAGMTKAEVQKLMGAPADVHFATPDVWYYYMQTVWYDGLRTQDECMPLVFRKDKLAGWGQEYYNREQMREPF